VYLNFCQKTEGNRPFGRIMRRWKHNIKMGSKEVGLKVVDWTALAEGSDQFRTVVPTVMSFGLIK
jgi:hypothetical protein